MDISKITNFTIRVWDSQSGLHTSRHITYNSATNTIVYDQDDDFTFGEDVNVTLTIDILYQTGVPMRFYTWNFTIQRNENDGTFENIGEIEADCGPFSIVSGDFDNDRDLDSVVGEVLYRTISVLLNTGYGNFNRISTGDLGFFGPYQLASGDFDTDGDLDLAATDSQ